MNHLLLLRCSQTIAQFAGLCIGIIVMLAIATNAHSNESVKSADMDQARDAWVAPDEIGTLYQQHCANCHGEQLEGAALGPGLLAKLTRGDSISALNTSIADGVANTAMPAWSNTLHKDQINSLAIYLLEKRAVDTGDAGMGFGARTALPEGTQHSEKHRFEYAVIADGFLHPYAVAPLPNGEFLVTEKTRGLSLVNGDGTHRLISGTPKAYNDGQIRGTMYAGSGMMLDVAIHPDYLSNGWIYLSYGDRCDGCNDKLRQAGLPGSMLKLVRGKIKAGKWVDEQVIWQAPTNSYHPGPENGIGARIEFDRDGYVYLTIGSLDEVYRGVQDLDSPYGKVLRLHDDGRTPGDNPFADRRAALAEIWTLGHRTPQGLAYDANSGLLWQAEHGPRGGDEANILRAGRNYGWPLVSIGLDYDGSPISYAKKLGIAFDPATLEAPAIDWTPSPGVSNIVFYNHQLFSKWKNNLLVSTLKQNDLLRIELNGKKAVHSEVLIKGLGRFRDLAVDADGHLIILLEHLQGSRIVSVSPLPK